MLVTIEGFLASSPVLKLLDKYENKHLLEYVSDGSLTGFTEDYVSIIISPLKTLQDKNLIWGIDKVYVKVYDSEEEYSLVINIERREVRTSVATLFYRGRFSVGDIAWLTIYGLTNTNVNYSIQPGPKWLVATEKDTGTYKISDIHKYSYASRYCTKEYVPMNKNLANYLLPDDNNVQFLVAKPLMFSELIHPPTEFRTKTGKMVYSILGGNYHVNTYACVVPPYLRSYTLLTDIANFSKGAERGD